MAGLTRTDIDVAAVENKAKEIMDAFFARLGTVDATFAVGLEREQTTRDSKPSCDPQFKRKFLKNAPARDEDYLLAERKTW